MENARIHPTDSGIAEIKEIFYVLRGTKRNKKKNKKRKSSKLQKLNLWKLVLAIQSDINNPTKFSSCLLKFCFSSSRSKPCSIICVFRHELVCIT